MAKFCTKCGRKLQDGEVCVCTQGSQVHQGYRGSEPTQSSQPQMNQPHQQESSANQSTGNTYHQDQQFYGRTKESQWVNDKKDAFVSGTRNMFSEIIPLLKAPVSATKNIAAKNSPSIGMQFIIVKAAVFLLIVLIGMGKLSEMFGGFIELPYIEIIFITLALTIGADCLEALIMKVFTGVANGITNWNDMITSVGVRTLFETLIVLVTTILCLVSPKIGIGLGAISLVLLPYIQYSSYQVLSGIKEDKKPYVFFIAKIFMLGIIYLFIYLMAKNMVGTSIEQLKSMIMSFL